MAAAQSDDALRWLEDPEAEAVVAWRDARTEDAVAWVDADPSLEALERWVRSWRRHLDARTVVIDAASGVVIWSTTHPDPANEAEPDPRLWKHHTELRVQADGADHVVELEGLDVESWWWACPTALSADGAWLLWGKRLPEPDPLEPGKEPQPCRVFLTRVGTQQHRSLGDLRLLWAHFDRDTPTVRLTTREGRTTRVERRALENDHMEVVFERRGWWAYSEMESNLRLLWTASGRKRAERWRPHTMWVGRTEHRFRLPAKSFAWAGWHDDRLLLRTRVGAEHQRIVALDPAASRRRHWTERLADTDEAPFESVLWVEDRYLVTQRVDGTLRFTERDAAGAVLGEPIGGPFSWLRVQHTLSPQALLTGSSPRGTEAWTRDRGTGAYTAVQAMPYGVPTRFEQVEATSADGTEIPISIVAPAGLQPTPDTPVWLHVYGGFGVAMRPATHPMWLDLGGIVATVHARGGNERGDAWHEQAQRENLGRTVDDVLAAAEWFLEAGWSSEGRLVVSGGSNGGLTAMAAVAREPTWFGAAMSAAGVHDLIRGPEMGRWWPSEYGLPSDRAQREVLLALSPVHARPDGLPPIWITTGHRDPTVTPSHSYKLAQAWSDVAGGPVLLRVHPWHSHAGHLPEKEREAALQEVTAPDRDRTHAEELGFLIRALGLQAEAHERLAAAPNEP